MIGSSGTPIAKEKTETSSTAVGQSDEAQQELQGLINQFEGATIEGPAIPSLVKNVFSADKKEQYDGVMGLRKLLSREKNPPIQETLDSGVVPTLVELVSTASDPSTQFEAAWCLTNLVSGTSKHVAQVVENGVIPSFISVLESPHNDLVDQAIWGLGNIAGDSASFRNLIIQHGAVEPMVKVLEETTKTTIKRNGTWTLSNICRGKPAPAYVGIARIVPLFCKLLKSEQDQEVLTDAAWGLSHCTASDEGINDALSNNVASRLVELLSNPSLSIITPCLRTVGNIIAGPDEQTTQLLKEKDLLPNLLALLDNQKKIIRKETLWILSNITAGSPVQFESIMGNNAFVEKIIHSAKMDSEDVKREAAFVLSNSTTECTPAQIIRVLNNGVFDCLAELLGSSDEKVLSVALEGISNCLKWGKQFNLNDENGDNKFVTRLEINEGIGKLENLQTHPSQKVYNAVCNILENYLETE